MVDKVFVVSELEDLELLFKSLKAQIESAEGSGFHNKDQGHPFYAMPAAGKAWPEAYADGPETNRLYRLLAEICRILKANDYTEFNWWYDFSEWQSFCKFAVDAHNKKRGIGEQPA